MRLVLDELAAVCGKGTTLVTLYVPGTIAQLNRATQLVTAEYGTAKNIKSSQTRNAVIDSLKSVQQQLKLYQKKIPENGIVVLSGNGKSQVIEPPKPIHSLMYKCDSAFYLAPLLEMLEKEGDEFGFIILDGKEVLFARVEGARRGSTILARYNVDLPSKHGRGGQSANRFARQRV